MANSNIAAVLHGPGDLRIEDRPIPTPSDGEVQVRVVAVGVCGSDLAVYRRGRVGQAILEQPLVLGHEPAGVVTALGQGVTGLSIGERVALLPHYSCGACRTCEGGRYNLCRGNRMMATPPTNGVLARWVVWQARLCHKLPMSLSWDEAALVQPLALALYACERAGLKPGHHVLVTGAGPMGAMMVVAARALGATKICVTDISEDRLNFLSEKYDCLVYLANDGSPQDISSVVTSMLDDVVDITFECSGAQSAIALGIYAAKPGGVVLLTGICPPEVTIPLLAALFKEVDIRSMLRFVHTYPAAIELMAGKHVDVKPLVAHHFPLVETKKAMEAMGSRVRGKVVIVCDEDRMTQL